MIKEGDTVKIAETSQFYNLSRRDGQTEKSNPTGMPGVVKMINDESMFGFNIKVEWDNGKWNTYAPIDLEVVNGIN